MYISSNFDSGNIRVISSDNAANIELEIINDNNSEYYQWFYFRLSGCRSQGCNIAINNATGAAYPGGFQQYSLLYSYDRQNWLRHSTDMRDGRLCFEFTPDSDIVYFAYFIPYPMERHHDLVTKALQSPHCRHSHLGNTLDGQDMDLLQFSIQDGGHSNRKNCWIIARQHPGESMAEWWMEGLIERLMDGNDKPVNELLSKANLFLVPNMNPDGSRRGHLRTNAVGRNLNREWQTPSMEHSPEVYLVKRAMAATGVDFFLDVHGDETLPYCFIAGTEGLSDWDVDKQEQLDFYKNTLAEMNPDFQTAEGYPAKSPGQANLTMSTAQTASNHGCLAMTLEMPFKDTTATPDPVYGWSTGRCKKLAHSCMDALLAYLNQKFIA